MKEFMESEAFCSGVAVGIHLFQQRVVTAFQHGGPIKINGELYYIQDGRERLQETIDKMCR